MHVQYDYMASLAGFHALPEDRPGVRPREGGCGVFGLESDGVEAVGVSCRTGDLPRVSQTQIIQTVVRYGVRTVPFYRCGEQ